jgi:FkbH-like protein
VSADQRIHLFDSGRWIAQAGARAYDARMWYLAKTPFAVDVFKSAARDLSAALHGIAGGARKLVILDLDDTLWGGVVGDIGWRALRLGGHDAAGEAFRDFQLALKALARRGVLLAIASKNEERTALEAITNHPEMVLKLDDFAGWRIDWNDKAHNIAELVAELNLGLDAAVLIDDHPVERARVAQALPALLVPEWPRSPLEFASALRALDCFDAPTLSAEDRERGAMYVSERRRKQVQQTVPSLEDWLSTLELRVKVEELSAANLERAAQLLNKTNQMNLRTRRLSASEMRAWASAPEHRVLVFRVADKFGDYGLVGIGSLRLDRAAATANIEDFVLSCRVMGRRIEETMLHVLAAEARRAGLSSLRAEYLPTARNQPCLRFFHGSGMTQSSGDSDASPVFAWRLDRDYSLPECISLTHEPADLAATDKPTNSPLAHHRARPAAQVAD